MTSPTSTSRPFVFVDDEPLILESFGQLFRTFLSCPVHCFSCPADALAKLPALNPGLILTDYSMPEMNGLNFLAQAHVLLSRTNFVILTGEPVEFDAAEVRRVPTLKGVLRKPMHWRQIAEFVIHHWPDEVAPVLQEPALVG